MYNEKDGGEMLDFVPSWILSLLTRSLKPTLIGLIRHPLWAEDDSYTT